MLQALGFVVSLVLIVALVVKRVNYGVALFIGTFALALFSQLSFQELGEVFKGVLTDPTTWDLVLITSLIPILAFCMRETEMVSKLIENMKSLVSGRATLAILPAMMGALPTPGGALMSAPMIEEESRRVGLTAEDESFINVWFRHWNFFVYPLTPTLILVSSLTGIALFTLIGMQILPLLLYLFIGYAVSIRKINESKEAGSSGGRKGLGLILLNVSPILTTIALNLLGVPMWAALALGIAFIFALKRIGLKKMTMLIKDGFNWRPVFAILGVMCLRYMIKESGATEAILPYAKAAGLPTNLLLLLVSWAIGLMTAHPQASVAIVFPMASTIVEHFTPILVSTLYLTIVFSYIMSPLHLCLILTVEYFRSRLQNVYRKLIPSILIAYITFLAVALAIQA